MNTKHSWPKIPQSEAEEFALFLGLIPRENYNERTL